MRPMRTGERSSALWGNGDGTRRRTGLTVATAVVACVVAAWTGSTANASTSHWSSSGAHRTTAFILPSLLSQAQASPSTSFPVIVQGDGSSNADQLAHKIAAWATQGDAASHDADQILRQKVKYEFSSIDGVAVTLTGRQIVKLADHAKDGLVAVTPDAPVQVSGSAPHWSSDQLWPYESNIANTWPKERNDGFAGALPSIAIVDSGIQADRADFAGRVIAQVDLSTLPTGLTPGDQRGHGTFVAGIAAGGVPGMTGAAPAANLVDVKVMDASGMGRTSDIINACQWILDHKATYNIEVANFSLHSAITAPFYLDPLDRAVEQLWFNGVVVVTAAGNYGSSDGPSGVLFSPGDDPFVITVGAADPGGSPNPNKADVAPWSAWGHTIDGFGKPEISAPGRYMIGPVPPTSTLVGERPGNVTAPGYMMLSGTSFAAPVVAGAAANVLAAHPNFTPDQVKGALMLKAKGLGNVGGAGGVGIVQASDSLAVNSPPNPNLGLDRFVTVTIGSDGATRYGFNSVSWNDTASSNASWNDVSWNDGAWSSASWNSVSWNDVSWNDASWNDVSWNDASWNDVSWNDVALAAAAREDAAEGDATSDPSASALTAVDLAALLADPALAPDPTTLPDDLAALLPTAPTTAVSAGP